MQDSYITLAHGNGGYYMRELIEVIFAKCLSYPELDVHSDAVALPSHQDLVITTDGFTVKPLEFPGGDIGSLAIHGTVNDLAVVGAIPRYITLNVFLEEGFEVVQLKRIITHLAEAARENGVIVVAGDTKVVPRGEGGGLYLATTGVGERQREVKLSMTQIQPNDAILVSGPIGDHGIAVMLAREQFGLRGELRSDAASVLPLTQALLPLAGLRFMRDPTRGGLATVCHEISHVTGYTLRLHQAAIPICDPVQTVCEMLGFDPFYLACEGRVVAIVASEQAEMALNLWQALPQGEQAAVIGYVQANEPARVVLETELGGERVLEELLDDPLPRIC
jgi:hydrogenase expression/formation protein HypE